MSITPSEHEMQAIVAQTIIEELDAELEAVLKHSFSEIGRVIQKAKDSLPHGAYMEWLRNKNISQPTAWRYRKLYNEPEYFHKLKSFKVNDLPQIEGPDEEEQVEAGQQYLLSGDELQELQTADGVSTVFDVRQGKNGDSEYYTKAFIIERVREVLGEIDLDPASCAMANETVQAKVYYTREQDGLSQPWYGKVFLNPPFNENPRAGIWATRLLQEYQAGHVQEAVLLTSVNAFYTNWWPPFYAFPRCIVHGKAYFDEPPEQIEKRVAEGKPEKVGAPFAIVLLYLGDNSKAFVEAFSDIGQVDGVEVEPEDEGQLAVDPIMTKLINDATPEQLQQARLALMGQVPVQPAIHGQRHSMGSGVSHHGEHWVDEDGKHHWKDVNAYREHAHMMAGKGEIVDDEQTYWIGHHQEKRVRLTVDEDQRNSILAYLLEMCGDEGKGAEHVVGDVVLRLVLEYGYDAVKTQLLKRKPKPQPVYSGRYVEPYVELDEVIEER